MIIDPIIAATALTLLRPVQFDTNRVAEIVDQSRLVQKVWRGRGRAPAGYLQGMAYLFAHVSQEFMAGIPAAVEIAQAVRDDSSRDALAWLSTEFKSLAMDNSDTSLETLRHVFVLLVGLGMRESSGRYCEGAYNNWKSDTAEAGLFQMSWDAHPASPEIRKLFEEYSTRENVASLAGVFSQEVRCRRHHFRNYGSGEGREFQLLAKFSPAFAVKSAAVGLRNLRTHWGPINRKEIELSWDANFMLYLIQREVEPSLLSWGGDFDLHATLPMNCCSRLLP